MTIDHRLGILKRITDSHIISPIRIISKNGKVMEVKVDDDGFETNDLPPISPTPSHEDN